MPSFSYPSSRASGYVVQATDWNTDIVGNIQWLGKDRPAVLAIETTNQSIATGAGQAITYNDTDVYDTMSQHDVATNTSRITCGTGNTGLYYFHATGLFATHATATRTIALRLNGTTEVYKISAPPNFAWYWTIEGFYRFTATTDYMEVIAAQDSGAGLNISNATFSSKFGAVWTGQ